MTLLQAYLQSPKARRTLSKRPGDKGFSLIELVVVVAILAILAAVALPNFLGVSKDGQIAAAKNTLATIIKECSVKETRSGGATYGFTGGTGANAPVQAATGNLNGYIITYDGSPATADSSHTITIPNSGATAAAKSCYSASAVPQTLTALPIFSVSFNPTTGVTDKTCKTPAAGGYNEGCFKPNTNETQAAGTNGTW